MDKVKAIAGIVVAIVGLFFFFLHPSIELVYKYDSFSLVLLSLVPFLSFMLQVS